MTDGLKVLFCDGSTRDPLLALRNAAAMSHAVAEQFARIYGENSPGSAAHEREAKQVEALAEQIAKERVDAWHALERLAWEMSFKGPESWAILKARVDGSCIECGEPVCADDDWGPGRTDPAYSLCVSHYEAMLVDAGASGR